MAVERDLKELGRRSADLPKSALAAAALALARELDDPGNSATSKSMCSKELRETLDRLRALAPAEKQEDGLNELERRRAARLARGAGT